MKSYVRTKIILYYVLIVFGLVMIFISFSNLTNFLQKANDTHIYETDTTSAKIYLNDLENQLVYAVKKELENDKKDSLDIMLENCITNEFKQARKKNIDGNTYTSLIVLWSILFIFSVIMTIVLFLRKDDYELSIHMTASQIERLKKNYWYSKEADKDRNDENKQKE